MSLRGSDLLTKKAKDGSLYGNPRKAYRTSNTVWEQRQTWAEGTELNRGRRGGSKGQRPMGTRESGAEEGHPTRRTQWGNRCGALQQTGTSGDGERKEHSREGTYLVNGG